MEQLVRLIEDKQITIDYEEKINLQQIIYEKSDELTEKYEEIQTLERDVTKFRTQFENLDLAARMG